MTQRLYMESTSISAEQTAGEIQSLLAKAGAHSVTMEYEGGELSAVSFVVRVASPHPDRQPDMWIPYTLPARVEPVYKILHGRRKRHTSNYVSRDKEQAKRTAWRLVLRWVQAQLSMIETGMVTLPEVMTPYIKLRDGQTLGKLVSQRGLPALPCMPSENQAD